MLKKFVLSLTLAGVGLLGLDLASHTANAQSQRDPNSPNQQQAPSKPSTKAVTGTVASIGTGGHSFTLQVGSNGGSSKSNADTMNFVVDNNTQVQGQVKVGTSVTVEYQIMASGENVAVTVTAQA